jgi:hypothetical protein
LRRLAEVVFIGNERLDDGGTDTSRHSSYLTIGEPAKNKLQVAVLASAKRGQHHEQCRQCWEGGSASFCQETHTFRSIMEWPKRMDLWKQWQVILHCLDDPNRDFRARLFYEANLEAMNA